MEDYETETLENAPRIVAEYHAEGRREWSADLGTRGGTARIWEIFDPKDGITLYRTQFRWIARLIVSFFRRLDYARPGEGFLKPQ